MKKLLSVLASLSVTGVAAISVVSCSVPTTTINVYFSGKKEDGTYEINKKNYSIHDLANAMNVRTVNNSGGDLNSLTAMSFNRLNTTLLNLLSFNSSLVVKTQKNNAQLWSNRDAFLGRDDSKSATVDGTYFESVDTSREKYYENFKDTAISSLMGLNDLYQYHKDEKAKGIDGLKTDANGSVKAAEEAFNSDDAQAFIKDFANSKLNPAFTEITYDVPGFVEYNTKTQLMNFNENKDNKDIKLGEVKPFADNNNNVVPDSNDTSKKIPDNRKVDPLGAVILGKDQVDFENKINFLPVNLDDDKNKDRSLPSTFTTDNKETLNLLQFTKTKDKNTIYGTQSGIINNYFVKKVEGVKVNLKYTTNTRDKNAKKYDISFGLENLVEVFQPVISGVDSIQINKIEKKDDNLVLTLNKDLNKEKKDAPDSITNVSIKVNESESHQLALDEVDGNKITIKGGKALLGEGDNTITVVSPQKGILVDGSTYSFSGDSNNYNNYQLVWEFSGYKFISDSNVPQATTDIKPVEKDDEKMVTEVHHHLRDLKTTGWKIEAEK